MPETAISVLMTTDAVGGIWTYALDLGRELGAGGIDVTLAVLGPPLDPAQREAARRAGLGLVETGLRPEWLAADETEVARAGAALAALAGERRADLVHLNHPALAACGAFDVPLLAVCHSCVATWWHAVRGTPQPDDFAWRADLVRRGYRAAEALVAPSQAFATATQGAYDLASRPLVIRNARAPRRHDPDGAPVAAAFTAGRLWDEGKNVAALDRAAALIDAPVRAAGPTRGPNGACVALDHLEGLGTLTDAAMHVALAARPVYVSTALYEPFGLAVLEAAQAGCALVLSDIPTFRELWDGAALFVPPRDEQAIAAAVNGLLAHGDRRADLAQAAGSRSLGFGLHECSAGYAALYARLRPRHPVAGQAA